MYPGMLLGRGCVSWHALGKGVYPSLHIGRDVDRVCVSTGGAGQRGCVDRVGVDRLGVHRGVVHPSGTPHPPRTATEAGGIHFVEIYAFFVRLSDFMAAFPLN